jgi:RNA polymerase sigma factor (sigma-70 family)
MDISAELLEDCRKGNRKAQFRLYALCYPMLMGICMRYKRDETEAASALNIGFLKIVTGLGNRNTAAPFHAWAKRVMVNTLIDDFRRQQKEQLTDYTDFAEGGGFMPPTTQNEAAQELDAAAIEQHIQSLPNMMRQVFNLFAIDGYSHSEIAEMLGIKEGTSKWHLSAARQRLKELLFGIENTR